MNDFSVSPDSAWLATATPVLKKRGSICPQLAPGSRGWSVVGESPAMNTVGILSTRVISRDPRQGLVLLNSSVSLSSQWYTSPRGPFSRSLRTTWSPPGAFFGGGGTLGFRTLTTKVRVVTSPFAVATLSSIRRRDSALTVITDSPSGSPRVTVTL